MKEPHFQKMKKTALFVNTGRSSTVDEAVLTPLVGEYHGRIVKVIGDGAFAVGVTFLILARRPLTKLVAQHLKKCM